MVAIKENIEDEWTFLEDNSYGDCWGYLKSLGIRYKNMLSVTPNNLVIADKVYDGNTAASVRDWGILRQGSNTMAATDLRIKGSSFLGEFSSPDVGDNKGVQLMQPLQMEGNLAVTQYYISNYGNLKPTKLKASITKAPLTIRAKKQKMKLGSNPQSMTFTSDDYTIEGFVNNEDQSVLSSLPVMTIASDITSGTSKGTYTDKVIISGATAANYEITFESADLEVTDDIWTGISDSEYAPFEIKISPNPVRYGEAISISIVENTEKQAGEVKVEIFNPQGVRIMTSVLNNNSTVFSPEAQGVYIVRITVDNYCKIAKLIVK